MGKAKCQVVYNMPKEAIAVILGIIITPGYLRLDYIKP